MPTRVALREVTNANRSEKSSPRGREDQERFVGSVAGALPGEPRRFYGKLGFTPTEERDNNGEIIVRLDFTPSARDRL